MKEENDFGKMNDVYVIFIAPFDLFGKNKYMYTFRMTCDEVPGLSMGDGAVRIFLNTHGKNDIRCRLDWSSSLNMWKILTDMKKIFKIVVYENLQTRLRC